MGSEPNEAPATIVVVDDDPSLVEVLHELLAQEGFRAEGYTDAMAALDRLRAPAALLARPALLLVDCVMPRMGGAELVEALRAAGVNTPVLMMTALSDPQFCVEPGLASVISKPFEVDSLLAEIRRLLE